MKNIIVESFNEDDLKLAPQSFDNEEDNHAKVIMIDTHCTIMPENEDESPILYFRHNNPDSCRFGGFVRLGKTPLDYQTSEHHDDVAGKGAPFRPYVQTSIDPIEYVTGSDEPYSEFIYHEHDSIWKEGKDGSILNVKATNFPHAIKMHSPVTGWMSNPCLLEGTYEGKPFKGIGCVERVLAPVGFNPVNLGYVSLTCQGIREDGRRESFCFYQYDFEKPAVCYYWLEGEEPTVSENVKFEGEWVLLPYVDDGTYVCPKCTIYVGNKVVHFEGKWGTKGFTKEPLFEKHGQSQVFGTFYEGETPYKHALSHTFFENMSAYKAQLEAAGMHIKND